MNQYVFSAQNIVLIKKKQRKFSHTFSFSHDDQNLVDTGQNLVNWHGNQSISMVTAY